MFGFRRANSQIFTFFCGFLLFLNVYEILGTTSADSWLMFARETKNVLHKCYKNHIELADSWRCFKYNSLFLFDDITAADTIPLTNTLDFIPRPGLNKKQGNMTRRRFDANIPDQFSWTDEMKGRMIKALSTHGLRFKFHQSEVQPRSRRRRMQMFPAMIFGMAILGVIIIPIGFHIMTIIGGTAVLFAKMALLISIINGSTKRLPIPHGHHFGTYQQDHYYGGNWDRHEPHQPRY